MGPASDPIPPRNTCVPDEGTSIVTFEPRLADRPRMCKLDTKQRGEKMAKRKESFGALVRREREAREIGLREMAKMIGVSPTYQSKVERDEFGPPAEDKVRAIAAIIEQDVDELLALAGRVSSDLSDIIKNKPRETAALLRTVKGLSAKEVARLSREAEKSRGK